MHWLLALTSLLSISHIQIPAAAVDASAVRIGTPATITQLDLGKLKGELRQVGWSPDGTKLYVQTADGNPPSEKLRHYIVPVAGGAPAAVDAEPEWASTYWGIKSDRFAPGLRSLTIEVVQKSEKIKIGTGTGRPGEQAGGTGGSIPVDVEKTAEGQYQNLTRLTFLDEPVSEFVNQRAIPGLMFSWGPLGSGAIAYTDRESGQLMLFDQHKHKQTVGGVKDALLPAWSTDGTRLAWVKKDGRRKYSLMWAAVEIKG